MNLRAALVAAALAALCVLAFLLRSSSLADVALAPDERAQTNASWLLDDPASLARLRRIELGLAASRVPERDPFLDPPSGAVLPYLSVFDGFVAGVAQRTSASRGGEAALGGVAEADLEALVVRGAPVLGVLCVLATFWAAFVLARGPRRAACALVAALLVATSPSLVASASAGVVDGAVLATLLLALQVRCVARALGREDVLGAVLDALVGGVLAGLLCATSFAGLGVFAASWAGFLMGAFTGSDERREAHRRAGLLFCATSAFVSRLPLADGPWEVVGASAVAAYSAAVSTLCFVATAPFLLAFLARRKAPPRMFQAACFLIAIVVMILEGPRFLAGLAPAWELSRERLLVAASFDARAFDRLGIAFVVLALVSAACVLRRRHEPPVVAALATVVALAAAALIEPAATPLFVVAVACVVALGLDALEATAPLRARVLGAAAGVLAFAPLAVEAFAPARAAQREERLEVVAGLRWMRANTAAESAFNAPSGDSGRAVLATPRTGPLVAYHARRPPFASLDGKRARAEGAARLLLERDDERFAALFAQSGARYVVAGPRFVAELRAFAAREGLAVERSALERLTFTDAARELGLERVWSSSRLVDETGHAAESGLRRGPAFSLWRVPLEVRETPRAQIVPR